MAKQRHHWIGLGKRTCEHCGLRARTSMRSPGTWLKFYMAHGGTKWIARDRVPPCLPELKTWRDEWDAMRDEAATHNRSTPCTSETQ